MRFGLGLFTLFSILPAFANFPAVQLEHFRGHYQEPQGSARADKLSWQGQETRDVQIRVYKEPNAFRFVYEGEDFIFSNPPAMIHDVEKFQWKGVELRSRDERIEFDLGWLYTQAPEGRVEIREIQARCDAGSLSGADFSERLLDSCMKTGKLKINEYSQRKSGALSGGFERILLFFAYALRASSTPSGDDEIEIRRVRFQTRNHKLSLSLSVQGVSARLKASGMSWYLAEQKQIKLQIDKVKASTRDITDEVFQRLETQNWPGVRVERPFIYLQR